MVKWVPTILSVAQFVYSSAYIGRYCLRIICIFHSKTLGGSCCWRDCSSLRYTGGTICVQAIENSFYKPTQSNDRFILTCRLHRWAILNTVCPFCVDARLWQLQFPAVLGPVSASSNASSRHRNRYRNRFGVRFDQQFSIFHHEQEMQLWTCRPMILIGNNTQDMYHYLNSDLESSTARIVARVEKMSVLRIIKFTANSFYSIWSDLLSSRVK